MQQWFKIISVHLSLTHTATRCNIVITRPIISVRQFDMAPLLGDFLVLKLSIDLCRPRTLRWTFTITICNSQIYWYHNGWLFSSFSIQFWEKSPPAAYLILHCWVPDGVTLFMGLQRFSLVCIHCTWWVKVTRIKNIWPYSMLFLICKWKSVRGLIFFFFVHLK